MILSVFLSKLILVSLENSQGIIIHDSYIRIGGINLPPKVIEYFGLLSGSILVLFAFYLRKSSKARTHDLDSHP